MTQTMPDISELLRDSNQPQLQRIANVESKFTFKAKGVNVDYILYLEHNENEPFKRQYHQIEKLFNKAFDTINEFAYNNKVDDIYEIIDYVKTTKLISVSKELMKKSNEQEFFNYCVTTLSDKYIPRIYFDVDEKINSIPSKYKLLKEVYANQKKEIEQKKYEKESKKKEDLEDLNSVFYKSKKELKLELCNYIVLWIHAYRFLMARQQLSKNKKVIAFSHRYQGWSKPRYKVNDDLSIEFKTNFGYGNSSYFYLLLIFKGVQIFPFMDWVDYGYTQISQMENYTKKYHSEKEKPIHHQESISDEEFELMRDEVPETYIKREITQEDWYKAFDDLVDACNIYEKGVNDFIDEYIIKSLNHLIAKLETIINDSDASINKKYRNFNYNFSIAYRDEDFIKKIKLMDVKGALISGTLDLIGQVTKLKEIIDTTEYVKKIESLNHRILPILNDSVPQCQYAIETLEVNVQNHQNELIDIWQNQGLKQLKADFNKLSDDERLEFKKLDEKHKKLSEKKQIAEQDLKHSKNILNSIKRYIRNIERYFANTNQTQS